MFDRIEADYDRLDQIASQFMNQCKEMQQMLQAVKSSMDDLQGNWIGEGSDAFFSEMESEVLPATNRLVQALDEASRVTKVISQTVQQAEDDAAAPFRS